MLCRYNKINNYFIDNKKVFCRYKIFETYYCKTKSKKSICFMNYLEKIIDNNNYEALMHFFCFYRHT